MQLFAFLRPPVLLQTILRSKMSFCEPTAFFEWLFKRKNQAVKKQIAKQKKIAYFSTIKQKKNDHAAYI